MIDSRRKLLTVALGECWHDYKLSQGRGISTCSCGNKGMSVWDICTKANRTFSDADDYEALREKVVRNNLNKFACYIWSGMDDGERQQDALAYWLTLSPEERNETICDFIKANLHLFPKVVEYLASLVTIQPPSTQIASGKRMPWEEEK